MLVIQNTLSGKKEEFKPINPPHVSMYVCGPTVYDYFHIGNARSFLISDMIRRYLEYKGYNVKFVMNLTDVDDKIIHKSKKENRSFSQVADTFTQAFFEDIEKLKVKPATLYPKATGHISEIITLISNLIDNGFAYNIDGNVFYNVARFKDYGKLSGKKTDELEVGARIEINNEKLNPLDFALWKKAKEDEPSWNSPWGKGRPGWHIECSAMSCKHLGDTFDIHAGGSDLIFPHHENEIAQSEAATGKPFVNYWMHFGFLNINEEKMSKSLGNFFTARDILAKYPAEAIRMFLFQTHYASPLNFSEEAIQAAQKGLEKFTNLVDKINSELSAPSQAAPMTDFDFPTFYSAFESTMDDDFNSPKAIAVLFDFIKEVNRKITESPSLNSGFYLKTKEFLEKTAIGVFGITSFEKEVPASSGIEDKLIELLLSIRATAKKEKNFTLADQIRDELLNLGVAIRDTKDKTLFKKV
ncbi:MAG: cysteine--tRNA ligase [Ignavibacteriales bacterium]|jgi:cysteinyl-tRNA synthetase|nr:cysteine--tRNA ligase [Ignavibacteriaceae bacterium]NLH61429.1 cysteine--tRNA ligase [Ignavibacteriales bacterium]